MAKKIYKLTALAVQKASRPGMYGDGAGLWLQITPSGSKSWIFRYSRNGKARYMGLGPCHTVSLLEARDSALVCRKQLLQGVDPLEHRDALVVQVRFDEAHNKSFAECAETYIAAHEKSWKNDKHRKQWRSTLATYAYPVLGEVSVSEIDKELILKVLQPIWYDKGETASRLRGRIETILDWAAVKEYRKGDNPARWKGFLDKLLPAKNKLKEVKHHAAMPYAEVARFMSELQQREGISARALEFGILTAARSGEIRGAAWDEIDFDNSLWIIPAQRMKAKKEHRIPLPPKAIELLQSIPRSESGIVFASGRTQSALSDMSLTAVLKRMGRGELTQHGFRSTFRDWAAETTSYPREVIEHALAHQLADKTEAAYQRGDLLAKRTALMSDWVDYCYHFAAF